MIYNNIIMKKITLTYIYIKCVRKYEKGIFKGENLCLNLYQ